MEDLIKTKQLNIFHKGKDYLPFNSKKANFILLILIFKLQNIVFILLDTIKIKIQIIINITKKFI